MTEIERLNMIAEWQEQYKQLIEDLDNSKKRIAELEEQISVLLSCKNCSENKGGLICQKEYEDKCLAQKIQYIKELKEENAEWEKASDKWKSVYKLTDNQLTKAKEIINDLVHLGEFNEHTDEEYLNYQVHEALKNAEQFLNSEVEK